MKAEQVLTAEYELTDDPLAVDRIDGLEAAVDRVRQTKEKELVRCDDRIADYDVYWNDKTDTIRIAATFILASYEVDPEDVESE